MSHFILECAIRWLEREQYAHDGEFQYRLDPKFIEFHKKRNGKFSIPFQPLQDENIKLKKENENLEKENQASPRRIDEQCLAYFLIDKKQELKNSKDWWEDIKGPEISGKIQDRMKGFGLGIDQNSFRDVVQRACKRYLERKKPTISKK